MAIRTMTSKEVYEAAMAAGKTNVTKVTDYPGHEEGRWYHKSYASSADNPACPHANDSAFSFAKGPGCGRDCYSYGALYMETTHVGLVLATGEYNGYDDSDFYAVVWNPEKGCTEREVYASTRGWTYPNSATVDATPEVRKAYEAYCEAARKREMERRAAEAAAKAAAEAKKPAKGKMVKVVKGRKVPVGTTGMCFWVGAGHYGTRVGIKDSNGDVHWTAASNVEAM